MGVQVNSATAEGCVTPLCSRCGVWLCWDISKSEYEAARAFWDAWVCRKCNGGVPMRRDEFRKPYSAPELGQTSLARRCYTGIGSRETPTSVLGEMQVLAAALAQAGYTLRSGGADGADMAFEQGARTAPSTPMEIYLPWPGFNGSTSPLNRVERRALEVARRLHPAWDRLSQGAQKLHGRNCYQVLGFSLNVLSQFVVCWTADGCESHRTRSTRTGGTGTAIVLAEQHGVPVFNLNKSGRRAALAELLKTLEVPLPQGVLEEKGQGSLSLAV